VLLNYFIQLCDELCDVFVQFIDLYQKCFCSFSQKNIITVLNSSIYETIMPQLK